MIYMKKMSLLFLLLSYKKNFKNYKTLYPFSAILSIR